MPDDPKPNLDLLRRVLKQIDEHPETWEQECYAVRHPCGTAFCVAGHAAMMSGFKPRWNDLNNYSGNFYLMAPVARDALGITKQEASDLFCSVNDREDIQRIAEQIALRAGEAL